MTPTATISSSLHHLSARMTRETDQILQEQLGLTFAQFKILQAIEANPHLQQRIIAYSLGQTEASISRQIKLLMRNSMITVRINSRNRREHLAELTPKGSKHLAVAGKLVERYHADTFRNLSPKQHDQLATLLDAIDAHIW